MSIVYHLITMKIIEMNNQPFIGHPIIIVLEQTNDTYKMSNLNLSIQYR